MLLNAVGRRPLNASAFVVGPQDGAGAALQDMAKGLGFAPVERYTGLMRAERQTTLTPLVFFLCSAVKDVQTLKPMAHAVRFSPTLRLRFSPLIYFAFEPSVETIKACIGMGFDDVIALPYKSGDLRERLFRQVESLQSYFETPTYFGPERRNRVGSPRSTDSDHGGGQHRRFEIIRHIETGIEVLNDDSQVVV
jgi:PleD family two-component response regulator